jgi:Ca-activated chloride channel family protein
MDLLWPGYLLLFGIIPLIIAFYIWVLRRRRRFTIRYSSLSLIKAALPQQPHWKRHIPFGLFLLAMASLIFAMTRPVRIISLPANRTTIILAIDVSGSMRSSDISPTRLQAAQNAALSFIQNQKDTAQIGVVAFSGYGEIIQKPTTDQESLQSAVESLTTGRRTAIGSGILKSIDAISEVDSNVPPSDESLASGTSVTPVPKGAYAPDIIVLLTDGVSNIGPDPIEATQQAIDRGVRIYTIGFGSVPGIPKTGAGGGAQTGSLFRLGVDEATLRQVASTTGGQYYVASSAGELQKVLNSLPTYLIMRHEFTEISVIFAALAAVFVIGAIILSMIIHPVS